MPLPPPTPGPLRGASRVPSFSEGGMRPRPLRPPRPAPFQCSRSMVPPESPRASIAPSAGRVRNKDPWKWEAGSPGEPLANFGSDSLPGVAQDCKEARVAGCPRAPGGALPAGKLQRRKARVGQNPRADRPAPLPIPIHPARPVTTSLSLEEEFRRKEAENQSRCGEKAASLRRREQRARRLGPPRPQAAGAPPPRAPRPPHPSPGPLQCPRGPATPAAAPPAPSRSGFSTARTGAGVLGELGGDPGGSAAARAAGTSGTPGRRARRGSPRRKGRAPQAGQPCRAQGRQRASQSSP